MITFTQLKDVNPRDYDESWAIVHSLSFNVAGLIQVSDLAPSTSLFHDYLNWRDSGQWNLVQFQRQYVPRFLSDLKCNPMSIKLLNYLFQLDKYGKHISLSCFCEKEELCHRSIIAGLLQGAGCKVTAKHKYLEYWYLWNAM